MNKSYIVIDANTFDKDGIVFTFEIIGLMFIER
jgi:hypothetical protein